MKNLQEVYPGVKEDSPATIVDTQRENSAAESGEQRAQDDIEKQRPDSGDSDVVSTMQQPLAAPRATPQTSKNSAISESQEEETAATQRVTESAVDHRGSDFKELLDYYEKELGGKREGALEEKPPLKGVTTSNSTTSDNASKQSSGVLTVDDVGPPRSPTHTPHPSPSPEIKSSSDGTTKEGGGGGGLLSSLVGTKIVPMVAPLVTQLVSAVTVVGEGTAAVLVGRGDQADIAADETTVTKDLDQTTATTESVVEPTARTKEAPILRHVEQQLESQVVGPDTDQGGISKTAAHKEPVEGATQEELKQRENREEPTVPATLPTPIITEPDARTMTAIEKKAPKEEDDGVPVELEAQDETVVETVLVPKPTPAVVQEGEQGSVVAPQQKQEQQVPDKKEKKKHFQKLRAAVQRLFKLKSES